MEWPSAIDNPHRSYHRRSGRSWFIYLFSFVCIACSFGEKVALLHVAGGNGWQQYIRVHTQPRPQRAGRAAGSQSAEARLLFLRSSGIRFVGRRLLHSEPTQIIHTVAVWPRFPTYTHLSQNTTGPSLHISTRHDTFDVSSPCIWLCRACRTARLDTLDTTSSTGSTCRTCRVVSRRDVASQVEFGL